jgi:hypothetical protein
MEINVSAQYKFDKHKIRDCLWYEMNLRPQKHKRYNIYYSCYDESSDKFSTEIKQKKMGTPFLFLSEDYISTEDINQELIKKPEKKEPF